MMNAKGFWKKSVKEQPTRAERKVLKEQGVNMKDWKAVIAATAELREKNKPAPVPPKPTQEDLLTQILEELKKQNADEVKPVEVQEVKEEANALEEAVSEEETETKVKRTTSRKTKKA